MKKLKMFLTVFVGFWALLGVLGGLVVLGLYVVDLGYGALLALLVLSLLVAGTTLYGSDDKF